MITTTAQNSYVKSSVVPEFTVAVRYGESVEAKGNVSSQDKSENPFEGDKAIWIRSLDGERLYFHETDNFYLFQLVNHFFSPVPEIKKILLVRKSENVYQVWIVVFQAEDEVVDTIHEHEYSLIKYFKESIYFDFNIIEISEVDDYEFSDDAVLIFDRH